MKIIKNIIFAMIMHSAFFTGCMHDRDNPHDPNAVNNYYDGIPGICVKQGSIVIPDNGLYQIADTEVCDLRDIEFYIENTGTAYLLMEKMEITHSDAYSIVKLPVTPIDPGKSSIFTVRFSPLGNEDYFMIISIYYYDEDKEQAIFSFTVAGEGVDTPK